MVPLLWLMGSCTFRVCSLNPAFQYLLALNAALPGFMIYHAKRSHYFASINFVLFYLEVCMGVPVLLVAH